MMRMLSRRTNRGNRGFTLIELLVVVLILAILMSVAIPLYLSAVADSQKKTCRANMQTIANAVQAAHTKNQTGATPELDYANYIGAVTTVLEPDLKSLPVCPTNGTYSIAQGSSADNTTFAVACSVADHGSFEPGKDHN